MDFLVGDGTQPNTNRKPYRFRPLELLVTPADIWEKRVTSYSWHVLSTNLNTEWVKQIKYYQSQLSRWGRGVMVNGQVG